MFAIIKTGGKQYKVAADDILQIEKLDAQAGETITFDQVLMLGTGSDVTIGSPLVEGATVVAELVEQFRNKKIIVFKKKRRKKYRRTQGHRQNLSLVKITDILAAGQKPAKKAAAKKPAAEKAAKAPTAKKAPAAPKTEKTDFVDDLKLISGVGPALEKKLHALDVKSLKDVAKLTKADVTRIDEALSFKGRIDRDNWIQQAKDLVAGK
ncbi:LSU ribosomal protein L21p [hydrothermal vent metagenome]|uniref:LSU ribosomal protein L21p n=1 Tax=hydrothermal vent metagenome TaxID=652676 RepID=A0A3B0TXQ8_9ZZZZ